MAENPLVFISYSHRDEGWKDQLLPHIRMLEQLGTLTMWDDRQIGVGDAWFEEITEKLDRCAVAILLVSADFLASKFCMRNEVPPLLERRQRDGMLIVPILIQPCFWEGVAWLRAIQLLPRDGVAIAELAKAKRNRVFAEVARSISAFVEEGQEQALTQAEATWPAPLGIDIDRLPTSGYDLVGRDEELRLLNDAWDEGKVNVLSLVAWGGVGKSTLVNKWCEYLKADNFRGAKRVFGCSFFSQGINKPAASAEDLVAGALEFFGDPDSSVGSPWAKGERLADLVRCEKSLLILDGLEPLQDPYQGIKDPSVQRLVEELARDNAGLCVITTREPVKELADFHDDTLELNLEQISAEAGRALLRIKGVRGTDAELEQASHDFGNNALAINLLASYLRDIESHHIGEAAAILDLDFPDDQGRHPRRVMEAFAHRFGEGPALDLLHVLGLFDRPATGDCINALKTPPAVPGLTEHLTELSETHWLRLLDDLRDLGLVAEESKHEPDELDAHPLVREHFGQRLEAERPEAWRAGHGRLYEHLRDSAKEYPDTLTEMASLFQAMHHGCQAGRYEEAHEIHYRRVRRGNEYYQLHKLGAFGTDLASLAGLFDPPWGKPVTTLAERDQAVILGQVAFDLRALGRLREAVAPVRAALERVVAQEDWRNAARCAGNLSELHLTLGDVAAAVTTGEASVNHSDRSEDAVASRINLSIWADALHQAGEPARGQALFEAAEVLQGESEPPYPRLYSLAGYRYCDLLLGQSRADEVRERAAQTLEWVTQSDLGLLTIAVDHLSLGRAALALGEHGEARARLDQALDGLRKAGQMDQLPRGCLARAALFRESGDLALARRDLEEAMRIARRSEMRLFQCDAHLEYARLALAEGDKEKARGQVAEARRLVDETGYGRRRPEVEALEAEVR